MSLSVLIDEAEGSQDGTLYNPHSSYCVARR